MSASWKADSLDQLSERLKFFYEWAAENHNFNKPLRWTVTKDTRSKQQNRYLWGWLYRNIKDQLEAGGIVVTSDDGTEFPYTKDLLHEIFKERFLCYATIKRGGKERYLCWSTTELARTAQESHGSEKPSFSEYVTSIKQMVSQVWNIEVPDPPLLHCDYPELMDEMRAPHD